MSFTSVTFIFYFFPVFLALYLLAITTALRNLLLLVASLIFYAWGDLQYLPLLCLSVAVNYAIGRWMTVARNRRSALWLGIGLNLASLIVFKYAGFLLQAADPVRVWLDWPLMEFKTQLPIGISFYTFKAISYLVDIYRKDTPAERDALTFATYLTMFPQILAGPIERMADGTKELHGRSITLEKFRLGVDCFIVGIAQKLLLANTLAGTADRAFSTPAAALSADVAWLGLIAYTLQIYFDFAGYTNMAIGLGHMMGFTFPRNFNYPYAAKSVTDFWQRWHITLSTWLRDYVWYPLGANRRGASRTYLNLLIVFGLCGLWHGANYTFLLWGLFHGAVMGIERAWLLARLKRHSNAATVYAVFMVMLGWVLFRSESLPRAMGFFAAMAGAGAASSDLSAVLQSLSPDVLAALVLGGLFASPWPARGWDRVHSGITGWKDVSLRAASIAVMLAIFLVSLMVLAEGSHNPFLYFRF